ncbi:MAG: L-serine ammonia-lyase [Verrucomicrobiaceae bacterium]
MLSALDLFTIGIGPSSSHTVGPMRAARRFVLSLTGKGFIKRVAHMNCETYGSLAATGKGHGTDKAIILWWLGHDPETIDPDQSAELLKLNGRLTLPCGHSLAIDPSRDLEFKRFLPLPKHPNGMKFAAFDERGDLLLEETWYSLGGGFIVRDDAFGAEPAAASIPFSFTSGAELLAHCERESMGISQIVLANENAMRPEAETRARLDKIWTAMQDCVKRGCSREGQLPGGLHVPRRAKATYDKLCLGQESGMTDPLTVLDWVNLYALAVNEENAAGGRVVTAPTNGAAGVIPAALHYATRFRASPHADGVHRFLLTAGAIGLLYKRNASISGADVGCQGEVGVACSMAAAGLVEYCGGTPRQVENAAEIGMEHNLGLTCDPVGGLVQIPCIERNAMGAVKALNAARLALAGDGSHLISLDKVIKTMRDTGRDMSSKYKETSRGGLAVSVAEC